MTISNKQFIKIQGILGDQSFSVVLPKHYAVSLGISKGEYVKVALEGNRIVIERAD
jgi:antitoxin component of MazEF toxin-antitoxin module